MVLWRAIFEKSELMIRPAVACGIIDHKRAIVPVTNGAAALVPLILIYCPLGAVTCNIHTWSH